MSFTFNALKAIATLAGKQMLMYVTDDTKSAIETAGYFNDAANYTKQGDLLVVSGDLDGTPFTSNYITSSNDGSTVVITEQATTTQNSLQVLTVEVDALGTESDAYVVCPIAGELTAVYGVSNGANGTAASTIDITIDETVVGELSFADDYSAGSAVSDTDIVSNTLSAGEVIHIDNNGEGDGTGSATITLVVTPS